jgi:Uma2 family endonuclease
MITLQLRQIDVPEGQRLLLHNISWHEFEQILEELGEKRASRIAYSNGTLEIRMPLPEHEVNKELIGDMVKILLDELGKDRECFGSTTFKHQDMVHGIEPDNCFYIQNHALMIGKSRIDLSVDPPPDLAIEIDLTSKTQLSAYEALKVPEVWCYAERNLKINILRDGRYISVETSPTFPGLPVIEAIAKNIELSRTMGTNAALRAFRQWVREQKS